MPSSPQAASRSSPRSGHAGVWKLLLTVLLVLHLYVPLKTSALHDQLL
jgi:hypothetical protein